LVFKLLKRNPMDQAKRHIDKALEELNDGYDDYASGEYEKAARLFLEADRPDFAIKYLREASTCSLQHGDNQRAADLKTFAAEVLIAEGRFEEAGAVYAEASDHLLRDKKLSESTRASSISVLNYLAARNFDTAMNLYRKAEKRVSGVKEFSERMYDLATLCVQVLCEGADIKESEFDRAVSAAKPKQEEAELVRFVSESTKIAMKTDVSLDWAGPPMKSVTAKGLVELEFRYKCPVPVRVVSHKYNLSSSLVFEREPQIGTQTSSEESWLIVLKPVLSGEGVVGPFRLTLEGDNVLINRNTGELRFEIQRAPALLDLTLSPEKITCSMGDEVVFDAVVSNKGDGAADSIRIEILLSTGLELSVGPPVKTIQYLGVSEQMRFQVFVRSQMRGEGLLTVKAIDTKAGTELVRTSAIRVP